MKTEQTRFQYKLEDIVNSLGLLVSRTSKVYSDQRYEILMGTHWPKSLAHGSMAI